MSDLSLKSREWKPFYIKEVAEIMQGHDIYEEERIAGGVPYVTSTAKNNGVGYFVVNNNETLESGCLSVNRNGAVGFCFYHPYAALYGNDTRKLRPLNKNKYSSIFLSVCIELQRFCYGYGRKMGTARLNAQRIMLPLNAKGMPDWDFMEKYMRIAEARLLEKAINVLYKQLDSCGTKKPDLHHTNWKSFYFNQVFTEIKRGARLVKSEHIPGEVPYVSSTASKNGVDAFIGNSDSVREYSDCLTLANSGSVGSTFYHKYKFIASDHVTHLKTNGIDMHAYLFMIPIINRLSEKYSFNREITDARILREKLLLPATPAGQVDFDFMSSFVRYNKNRILKMALTHFTSVLSRHQND